MRIRQGFPPSPTGWSLGHGVCITFITNGTGRAQLFSFLHLKLWPFFQFLHLELFPLTIVFQMD